MAKITLVLMGLLSMWWFFQCLGDWFFWKVGRLDHAPQGDSVRA